VRDAVAQTRARGQRIALVPTMGFLHEGHLTLIDRARSLADWVAISVFVNPLQFGPGEDLDRYPRALERDADLAAARGADLLFAPTAAEMYPDGRPWIAVVPENGADRLCGTVRPGHFRGVLTVVAKLLGIFTPDVAVFGQKDFQQAALVRRMVKDLDLSVAIEVAPTVREPGGLAMSSRNTYLSSAERDAAQALAAGLRRAEALFRAGERDSATLVASIAGVLTARGVEAEYVEMVDPDSLDPLERARPGAVIALAAHVGSTRLIDNVILPDSDG
jgi:pantoate--beta-alanine ligase